MANGVRFELDIEQDLARLALEAIPIAETAAEILVDEIKARIPLTDIVSEPGEPPNSTGPYRESWKSTKARRRGDFVQANTFADPKEIPPKLPAILEYGSRETGLAPRPHVRPAEEARAARVDSEVQRLNAQNRREKL